MGKPMHEPTSCPACFGTRFWRLNLPCSMWVCARCHPPQPPEELITWLDAEIAKKNQTDR